METWYIEYENGSCSMLYDTLHEAEAALAEHASDLGAMPRWRHGRPVRMISSEGQKIVLPRDGFGEAGMA